MAISLQEQLLKAGVASKQQAKQAKQDKRKQAKQNKGAAQADDSAAQQAARDAARQAKQEKDRELNRQRQQEQARKAALAEVRQLLQQHAVNPPRDGETRYNFVHENKVKSLWINQALLNQLARAQLLIVFFDERYQLVPAEIAERIAERLPEAVLPRPQQDTPDEDDPYADYQIPDDLMW